MTGEGTVVNTYSDYALTFSDYAIVKIKKTSACSHDCTECSTCTAPTFEVRVLNPVGAKKGDRVVIEADSKKILLISLLLYMLPVFFMIAAAAVCSAYSISASLTVLIFVLLFGGWFFLIRLVNRKCKPQNTIVSVIEKGLSPYEKN